MDKIAEYLNKQGIKTSSQRIVIYNYLYGNYMHPTADDIYSALVDANPKLSKTTVYNTLKLFVLKGVVNEITIEGNEKRYDANTLSHGHFKCKGCGVLFDFALGNQIQISSLEQFRIEEYHINLKGYCKVCNSGTT